MREERVEGWIYDRIDERTEECGAGESSGFRFCFFCLFGGPGGGLKIDLVQIFEGPRLRTGMVN